MALMRREISSPFLSSSLRIRIAACFSSGLLLPHLRLWAVEHYTKRT